MDGSQPRRNRQPDFEVGTQGKAAGDRTAASLLLRLYRHAARCLLLHSFPEETRRRNETRHMSSA